MTDESLINDPSPGEGEGGSNGTGDNEHAWFWNEGTQGEGAPPDWFKAEKYKSVADQAAAYTEAEKRLGGFTGAPDEYDLSLPEGYELPEGIESSLDKDDPLAQAFIEWGKENNVSQEAFGQILAMYTDSQVRDYKAAEESTLAQLQQLGDNRDARLDELAKWGKNNLDDEMYEMYKNSLTSADAVRVVEHLISKTRNAQLPDPSNINPNLMASKQLELKELEGAKDENGQLKWFHDPVHRAKIDALRKEIYGAGEHREIVGG